MLKDTAPAAVVRVVGSGVQKFMFRGETTLPMENTLPAKK
jgi:hypothetical protein